MSRTHISRAQSDQMRLNRFWSLCLVVIALGYGCHRSEFSTGLTTKCPEPEGSLVVLDYTLNCIYVGDTPETGCPEALPHDYLYRDTYICSERANATSGFLQAIIDTYLDVDAAITMPDEVSIISDAAIAMPNEITPNSDAANVQDSATDMSSDVDL